jgi:succinate-semialdehyde dehydrogenase/glutarate-semialdehyde dehydrogenase
MSSSTFSTVNPATGERIKTFHYMTWEQAQAEITASDNDFQKWRTWSFQKRGEVLKKIAGVLREHKQAFAQLMHLEMGKTLEEGKGEVEKCAVTCEYFADSAEGFLKTLPIKESPYKSAEITFQPQGVIFCIMPWNFPLWQVIRFAAPSLMAGNTVLLKHADITAGTGELLVQLTKPLLPDIQLIRHCHVDHEVAEKVIADRHVRGVTFTGSSRGGREVATTAAKNLKKIVLELGGSDAYIVLDDADIAYAAKMCAKGRLQNAGQSCVAAKRFIVVEKVAKEFISAFTNEMKASEVAPLAHKKFQGQLVEQVEKLKSWGGKVVLGGSIPEGVSAYYPPTVVVFEKDNANIHQEEVFGPVATVLVVKDEETAFKAANSSIYGLGGGLFTKDAARGKMLLETKLDAGFVVLNDFVKSDPHLTFGGVKESGYGRELGPYGILEFVNIKTVGFGGPS